MMRKSGGICFSLHRWYRAGISLRAVRSPLAPKMTIEQGSSALRDSPSRQTRGSSIRLDRFTGASIADI